MNSLVYFAAENPSILHVSQAWYSGPLPSVPYEGSTINARVTIVFLSLSFLLQDVVRGVVSKSQTIVFDTKLAL